MAGKVINFQERNQEGGWENGNMVKWRPNWLTSGKSHEGGGENGRLIKWRARWLTPGKNSSNNWED